MPTCWNSRGRDALWWHHGHCVALPCGNNGMTLNLSALSTTGTLPPAAAAS